MAIGTSKATLCNLLAGIVGAALLATPARAAETVTLDYRPSGYPAYDMKIADQWLKTRAQVIVTQNQESAAAIQVAYFAERGGQICARPGVRLYVRAPRSRGGATTKANDKYLGRSLKEGWYNPPSFGIGECL